MQTLILLDSIMVRSEEAGSVVELCMEAAHQGSTLLPCPCTVLETCSPPFRVCPVLVVGCSNPGWPVGEAVSAETNMTKGGIRSVYITHTNVTSFSESLLHDFPDDTLEDVSFLSNTLLKEMSFDLLQRQRKVKYFSLQWSPLLEKWTHLSGLQELE